MAVVCEAGAISETRIAFSDAEHLRRTESWAFLQLIRGTFLHLVFRSSSRFFLSNQWSWLWLRSDIIALGTSTLELNHFQCRKVRMLIVPLAYLLFFRRPVRAHLRFLLLHPWSTPHSNSHETQSPGSVHAKIWPTLSRAGYTICHYSSWLGTHGYVNRTLGCYLHTTR